MCLHSKQSTRFAERDLSQSTSTRRSRKRLAVTAGLLFTVATCAPAQEVSSSITGRITDPAGLSIQGATITATDNQRATRWSTTSNSDGVFAFPRIPVGTYDVHVEAKGFRPSVQSGVQLEINQRARIDVQMQLGAVTDQVQVTGVAPLLQTDTTQVGLVVTPATETNLPLNGRNYLQSTLLSPGTTNTDPVSFSNGARSTNAVGSPFVNGNRNTANNYMLDGIDSNSVTLNWVSYLPNIDAIQEFRVITNNASAEFGNYQGGIINVTIKSGTNQIHGSAFDFFRNDKLNANNWANDWQGLRKPALRQNVFGGTLGGPLRRDKMFLFVDYQGERQANPGVPTTFSLVPMSFRQGDFSALAIQLYNPLSLNASNIREPFPNNQVPLSMENPVARNLFTNLSLYPAPLTSALQFNSINVSNSYVFADQGDAKFDAKLSSRDDFSARYSHGRQDVPTRVAQPLVFPVVDTAPFQNGVLNLTHTFGPSLVNEARVGINRSLITLGYDSKGLGNVAEQLGIAQGNALAPGLLSLNFGGYSTSIGSANVGRQLFVADTTYQYSDNLTILHGRHMMKTGFLFMRQQFNFYDSSGGILGSMSYGGIFSSGPNTSAPSSVGFGIADFFMGYPSGLARGNSNGTVGQRGNITALYYQDDWRVTDTLTMNLGFRWEYHSPWGEVKNRQSNFSPFTGELELPGQNGNSRGLYNPHYDDYQPRVGLAWTPKFLGGRTVFRAAYGISSYLEGTGTTQRLALNPPSTFTYATTYTGPQVASTSDQGLTVLRAPGNPFTNASLRVWDPNLQPARVQQFNAILERQLPGQITLSAGYVGQHGTHLIDAVPYFQRRLLPDGTTQPSPYLAGNPQLAQITTATGTESDGNQLYNSLQVSGRKRLSQGLEFQLSYTWAKGMTDAKGFQTDAGQSAPETAYRQYLYNRSAEWAPSYFDLKHNFVYSFVYELPVGRNKALGGNWNPAVNKIFGDWRLSGILSLHTGFPLTIKARDVSGTVGQGPRANVVGSAPETQQVGPGGRWINIADFAQPVAKTLGNSGIGVIRGAGLRNFDLSLQKTIPLESRRLEFRAEFFNLTNTPHFNSPDNNVTSLTFGEILTSQGERNIQLALKFYF